MMYQKNQQQTRDNHIARLWLSRARRAWPEIGILLVLVLMIWTVAQPGPSSSAAISTKSSAVFLLPTSKIQSNLTGIQNGSTIVILLVDDKQVYRYPNTVLLDQHGNTVSISLKRDNNDTVVTDFAAQLASATAIYILPSLTG